MIPMGMAFALSEATGENARRDGEVRTGCEVLLIKYAD